MRKESCRVKRRGNESEEEQDSGQPTAQGNVGELAQAGSEALRAAATAKLREAAFVPWEN